MKTEKIGVTCVYEEDNLIAIIHKDAKSRKNIFYSCEEMEVKDSDVIPKHLEVDTK